MEKAHDLTQEKRTLDVLIAEDIHFRDMLLSDSTLKGLEAAGFKKPSPIQRKAIPLGRCGFDLIVQAKSGTGKTCVFTVIALEMLVPTMEKLQVVVLAPTREISVQIANVISSISQYSQKIKVETFIGGLPIEQDKKKIAKCQVAVGAPGRMKHLISSGLLDLSAVRLLVLDEADRLMEENFKNDISYIYTKLPHNKQIIAASATFPKDLEKFVSDYMKKHIKVSPGEETILIGVRQFVSIIPAHPTVLVQMKNKTAELIKILSSISFKQCLIFSNYHSRAESICDELTKEGWPATFINGSQTQVTRLKAYTSLKEYRCRILLSTDLTSRGIDAENVNVVVNLDLPYDGPTYLHRIGRAGRYGTYGLAITILQDGEEVEKFRKLLYEVGGENFKLSVLPKEKLTVDIWKTDDFEKLSSSVGSDKFVSKTDSEEPGKNTDTDHVPNYAKREDKAISVIHEYHLSVPLEKPVIDHYGSFIKELSNLDLNYEAENKIIKQEKGAVKVPTEVTSAVAHLERTGWESFDRNYELYKNKNNITPSCESLQTEVKEHISDNNYSDDSSHCEECSDSDISSSEISTSESESDDESRNKVMYNDNIYNWYSLWIEQSVCIKNYVQYCHYWKEMTNFS